MSTPHYADLAILEAAKVHADEFTRLHGAEGRQDEARHHKRMASWLYELEYLRQAKRAVRVALAHAESAVESLTENL